IEDRIAVLLTFFQGLSCAEFFNKRHEQIRVLLKQRVSDSCANDPPVFSANLLFLSAVRHLAVQNLYSRVSSRLPFFWRDNAGNIQIEKFFEGISGQGKERLVHFDELTIHGRDRDTKKARLEQCV